MDRPKDPSAPKPHGELGSSSSVTHSGRPPSAEPASGGGTAHPGATAGPIRGAAATYGDGSHLNVAPTAPPHTWTVTVSQAASKGWKLVDGQNCPIGYNGHPIIVHAALDSAKTTWTLTYVRDAS